MWDDSNNVVVRDRISYPRFSWHFRIQLYNPKIEFWIISHARRVFRALNYTFYDYSWFLTCWRYTFLYIIYLHDKIKNWWPHVSGLEIYKFIEVLKLLILVTHMYIFFTKERQNDINVFGTPCIHSSSSI